MADPGECVYDHGFALGGSGAGFTSTNRDGPVAGVGGGPVASKLSVVESLVQATYRVSSLWTLDSPVPAERARRFTFGVSVKLERSGLLSNVGDEISSHPTGARLAAP